MRIVIFDCETCQYEAADPAEERERQRAEREGLPPPEIKKKKHTTNFVSARVVCLDCIKKGHLTEGPPCAVCGPHKSVTFSQVPYEKTQVCEQFIATDPLDYFIEWLLFDLPREYDSVVWSHYGGKVFKFQIKNP